MSSSSRFADKNVIVTGAASGIGRAAVIRLVSEGANVLGVDLNAEGLAETTALAQTVAAHGGKVLTAVASVADEAAVKQVVNDFIAQQDSGTVVHLGELRRDLRLQRKAAQKRRAKGVDGLNAQPAGSFNRAGK